MSTSEKSITDSTTEFTGDQHFQRLFAPESGPPQVRKEDEPRSGSPVVEVPRDRLARKARLSDLFHRLDIRTHVRYM